MFVATIIFALAYVVLYPTLGNFQGVLNWSSANQWEKEVKSADDKYGPVFAKFADMSVEEISKNPEALEIGQRLFSNNCAVCHGSTAKGKLWVPKSLTVIGYMVANHRPLNKRFWVEDRVICLQRLETRYERFRNG